MQFTKRQVIGGDNNNQFIQHQYIRDQTKLRLSYTSKGIARRIKNEE